MPAEPLTVLVGGVVAAWVLLILALIAGLLRAGRRPAAASSATLRPGTPVRMPDGAAEEVELVLLTRQAGEGTILVITLRDPEGAPPP